MCINIGKIKIHITFLFAAFIAAVAAAENNRVLLLSFFAILLHEMTHLCLLLSYGCYPLDVVLLPAGMKITGKRLSTLSYRADTAVALGAPAVNIFLGLILLAAAYFTASELLFTASYVNLSLGAVNLLPLTCLDGGRVLGNYLKIHCDAQKAQSLSLKASAATLIFLSVITAVFFVMKKPGGYLLAFTAYCAVQTLKNRHVSA